MSLQTSAWRLAAHAWSVALALAMLLVVGSGTARAAPAAGSVIENTARATFFDNDRGFNATVLSNTVSVTVQVLEAVVLVSDNALRRAAGGIATMPHRLTNTGNAASTFVLTLGNRGDDDFDLLNLRLVLDRNGNGVADSGETVLPSGAPIGPLAAGEAVDLVVQGTVPEGVGVDRVARVDLQARSTMQAAVATNTDSVTVANGAQVQLVVMANNLAPAPGSLVTLNLTASNTGNRPAGGLTVTVDGTPMPLLLVRDVVPANTTFATMGAPGGAVALFHVRGQPEHTYTRVAPSDLTQVDAVAFGFAADLQPGQSLTRSINLTINTNASGPIVNIGQVMFIDGIQLQPVAVASNPVQMLVAGQAPRLRLFGDAGRDRPITVLAAGSPLFVVMDAARCNLDPQRVETHTVTVASRFAGDSEIFVATETGANSGVFRIDPAVPTLAAAAAVVVRGDLRVAVLPNDQILLTAAGCDGEPLKASVLVDPFGVVFDSKTNVAVAGARVTLLDVSGAGNGGRPGAPATVFLADGVTPSPSAVTTGLDGHYQFPLVAPSTYRLVVVPPSPYTFASTLAASLMPPGRSIDAAGSYGNVFSITAESEPLHIDIPVDADPRAGFFIEKTALRKTVELGEFVTYQVKVKNVTGQLLGRIRLRDVLPAGFAYLRGSARLDGGTARLNGSVLPEPEGGVGPALVFNLGSVVDGGVMTLTYRVRVGPGALQGDGINRAQATTAGPLPKLSNESRAVVQVLPGVFSDRGFLTGHVFADCNQNRIVDDGEPGIGGVRLWLQDGTHVTTDRLGRYSLYGLRPLTHVLKLDTTTLPFGVGPDGVAKLARLDNRQAGDAGSRFVDMKSGALQRADFAIDGCPDLALQAIKVRAEAMAFADQDTETVRDTRLAADPRVLPVPDPKSLPASGRVGLVPGVTGAGATQAQGQTRGQTLGLGAVVRSPSSASQSEPRSQTRTAASGSDAQAKGAAPIAGHQAPTDDELASWDNTAAFVSPLDQQVLGQAQTSVVVRGALAAVLQLSVNGQVIKPDRVGRLTKAPRPSDGGLQVIEYVGIDLKPGPNVLTLLQDHGHGSREPLSTISVVAPGALGKLSLTPPAHALSADGRSPVRVVIEPVDASGVAVTAPTAVTLQASRGRWRLRDLDPDEPGVQIFVEGGRLVAELESPAEPGDVMLQASSGAVQTQATLHFAPELRPLVAAGVVEGVLNLRRLDSRALQPVRAQDGFEQQLSGVSASFDNGRADVGARAALFLKGKVLGDTLLTLAFDSDKSSRERLFRDIQPGEYYPVYGDESAAGFDAQSTGRLYVRLDRGKSSVLLGDFNTQADPALNGGLMHVAGTAGAVMVEERRLGQYSRSLNGLWTHLQSDDDRAQVTAFATRTASRQVVDELPALGTSGPYVLTRAPMVENSEKVEVLTRDREQQALVLRRVQLIRFVDYELELLTGRLLLKSPLPTLDAAFHPNLLRVTYEVDQGGPKHTVAGATARLTVDPALTFHASVVQDNDPLKPLALQSVGATLRPAPGTALVAEFAHTDSPLGTVSSAALGSAWSGSAARVELRHAGPQAQLHAQAVQANAGFDNPSSGAPQARQEVIVKGAWKAEERTTIKAEVLRSEDLNTRAVREGAQLLVEQIVTPKMKVEVGVRHSRGAGLEATGASADAAAASGAAPLREVTTAIARVTAQVPEVPSASVNAEYEQALDDPQRRVAAVGGDYRLNAATRLYGRYEFLSSLGSRYGLNDAQQRNATVFGIQSEYLQGASVFSEYRLRDALDGRAAEAALGLRNRWRLGEGWSASTGYERVRSLDGPGIAATGGGDSTVVALGLEYLAPGDLKAAARVEVRNSNSTDTVLGTLGVAYKIDESWTALGRNLLTRAKQADGSEKTEDWLQLGVAWREAGARRRNALMRAEYRHEAGDKTLALNSRRNVATLSGHYSQQVSVRTVMAGRLASKWAREASAGMLDTYRTGLVSWRVTHDVTADWDIGVQAAALLGADGRSRHLSLGLEAGHGLTDNLWLSVGWNRFGFTDRDLTAQDYLQRGVYLRLRLKFDENAF